MTDPWQLLRMMRADPPGLASQDLRKRTFAAALEQSEQLWGAAATVTASASPILLFYGLVQGALALSAARTLDDNWEFKPGHGLSYTCPDKKGGAPPTLDDATVAEKREAGGDRGIQHVAKLLDSPAPTNPISLGVLACSLPEESEFLLSEPHPRPLFVNASVTDNKFVHTASAEEELTLLVGPVPAGLMEVPGTEDPETVETWLRAYPSLAALGRPVTVNVGPSVMDIDLPDPKPRYVTSKWQIDSPISGSELWTHVGTLMNSYVEPRPGIGVSGLVLPSLAGNVRVMHPLIGWWALLYAFSNLARYRPRSWTALIDLDRSVQAVPVQAILGTASRVVPHLLLTEISAG